MILMRQSSVAGLGLALLLCSCSFAEVQPSAAGPAKAAKAAKAAIIEDYKVVEEEGFTVNQQKITTAKGKPSASILGKASTDNRTLVAYFAKQKINIVPCSYEVSIHRHDFKFAAGQVPESLTAYLYRVEFKTCQNLLMPLSALAKESPYPSASDSTQKYPSTIYLLYHNNPVAIVSFYGLAGYYPQPLRDAVLEKFSAGIR